MLCKHRSYTVYVSSTQPGAAKLEGDTLSHLRHAATHYVRKSFESSQMEEAAFVLTPFIKTLFQAPSQAPTLGPGGVEEAGQLETGSAGGGRQAGLLAMRMCMGMQMWMWQQQKRSDDGSSRVR